jgi:hypothetical protein
LSHAPAIVEPAWLPGTTIKPHLPCIIRQLPADRQVPGETTALSRVGSCQLTGNTTQELLTLIEARAFILSIVNIDILSTSCDIAQHEAGEAVHPMNC